MQQSSSSLTLSIAIEAATFPEQTWLLWPGYLGRLSHCSFGYVSGQVCRKGCIAETKQSSSDRAGHLGYSRWSLEPRVGSHAWWEGQILTKYRQQAWRSVFVSQWPQDVLTENGGWIRYALGNS
jgi:hypothetical protein